MCFSQQINHSKSKVFFSNNVSQDLVETLSNNIQIGITNDLGHYLVVPMIISRKDKDMYTYIVDRIRKKLFEWKAKNLSFTGRVTLAQSSIMSLSAYVMQIMTLPASICDKVELLCRNFIWGSTSDARKCHLISGESICRPKEEGGLGFSNLRMVNRSFLMKLCWNLMTNHKALWVELVRAKYSYGRSILPNMKLGSRPSHLWRGMIQSWPYIEQDPSWVVRDGQDVRFWQDSWVPNFGPLKDHVVSDIPHYARNFLVSSHCSSCGWSWDGFSGFLPEAICQKIAGIRPPPQGCFDFPIWVFSSDRFFSIKSMYVFLYE